MNFLSGLFGSSNQYKRELRLRNSGMRVYDNHDTNNLRKLSPAELNCIHKSRDVYPSPVMQREARINRENYRKERRLSEPDFEPKWTSVITVVDISNLATGDPGYLSPAPRFLVDLFYDKGNFEKLKQDTTITNTVVNIQGEVLAVNTSKEPTIDTIIAETDSKKIFKSQQYPRLVAIPLSTLIQECFSEETLRQIEKQDPDFYSKLKQYISLFQEGLKKWGREQDPNIVFQMNTSNDTGTSVQGSFKIGTILQTLQQIYEKNLVLPTKAVQPLKEPQAESPQTHKNRLELALDDYDIGECPAGDDGDRWLHKDIPLDQIEKYNIKPPLSN